MLTSSYDKLIFMIPQIISLLVTVLPFLLACIVIHKVRREKYLMDLKCKAVAVNLRVTNYEVANQRRKLKCLEDEINILANKIKNLG